MDWPERILLTAAVVTALGVLWAVFYKSYHKIRYCIERLDSLIDSVLGADPLIDPISQTVLRPALPGICARMEAIEQWQITTAETLQHIAETQSRLVDIDQRLTDLVEHKNSEHQRIWEAIESLQPKPDTETP